MVWPFCKTVWQALEKSKLGLPCNGRDPAIPLPGTAPREMETYVATTYNIHSNIIYKGQKLETTQMIISGLGNKMHSPYNIIYSTGASEELINVLTWLNLRRITLNERNQTKKASGRISLM